MSLVSAWNYEGSGSVVDLTGNGNGFALSGTTARTAAGGGYTYGGARPNKVGLVAGGTGIQNGPAVVTPYNTTLRTWATWVKGVPVNPSWFMEAYVSSGDTGAFGWLMLNSTFRARAKNSSNAVFEATASTDSGYRFVALTHDGASFKSYRDDGAGAISLLQSTPMASAVWAMTALRVFDAAGSGVTLSDTRMYNEVLDSTALTSLLTTPLDTPAASFVGWGVPL